MLDNLSGSNGLSEQEIVQKMQTAREPEQETPEQDVPTGETVEEESSEELVEEEVDGSEGEIESYEEEEEPEVYVVKVNGEDREVSFDQLIEGYSKGEDYTKKTMAVADERKALEAQILESKESKAKFDAETVRFSDAIQQLEAIIKEAEGAIDWDELRETDPSEYLRQKELQQKHVDALQKAKSERSEMDQKRFNEALQSETQKLSKVKSEEWKNPDVREKEINRAYEYVYSRGISEQEAQSLIDHRFWLMVMDAAKYEDLQKAGDVVKKEVKKAPKTVKPTKAKSKRTVQELDDKRNKLRKSGSEADALALLKAKRLNR